MTQTSPPRPPSPATTLLGLPDGCGAGEGGAAPRDNGSAHSLVEASSPTTPPPPNISFPPLPRPSRSGFREPWSWERARGVRSAFSRRHVSGIKLKLKLRLGIGLRLGLGLGAGLGLGCGAPAVSGAVKVAAAPAIQHGIDGSAWLAPDVARARAAGAGALEVLAADVASEGDCIGAFVELQAGVCVLAVARASPGVVDVDLFAFEDDGSAFATDESPDSAGRVDALPVVGAKALRRRARRRRRGDCRARRPPDPEGPRGGGAEGGERPRPRRRGGARRRLARRRRPRPRAPRRARRPLGRGPSRRRPDRSAGADAPHHAGRGGSLPRCPGLAER